MNPFIVFLVILSILIFLLGPVRATQEEDSKMLQGVISGAGNQFIQGVGNDLLKDSKLTQTKNLSASNNLTTSKNDTVVNNVGMFDSIKEPIPYTTEQYFKDRLRTSIGLVVITAKTIIILTALACLLQIVFPNAFADVTAFFYGGRAIYYDPKEVLITGRNIALGFLSGPGLLLTMFIICNSIVAGQDTSVLDQVRVSSEGLVNYLFFGISVKIVKVYMAIRSMIFLEVSDYWYVFGFFVAIKKTRWVAILALEYLAIQVFTQPLLISILTNVVAFTLSGGFERFGPDMLMYASLCSLMSIICIVAFTAPIWIKLFSPSTIKTIIGHAKGF